MSDISEAAKKASRAIIDREQDCQKCEWYPRGCCFERVLYKANGDADYCMIDAEIIQQAIDTEIGRREKNRVDDLEKEVRELSLHVNRSLPFGGLGKML